MSKCDPSCPICGGLGLYRLDVPPGHPDFGKLFPCDNLDKKFLPQYLRSGLHESEQRLTWADVWDLGNVKEAIQYTKMALDLGYGFIFLHGAWGNGKTHILKVAVSLALAKGWRASYVNMSDMIESMRKARFDPDGDDDKGNQTYWANCKVLAIDELDKVRDTEFSKEQRFRLFDERYVMATRMQNLTIVASNDEPGAYYGEIHSRLNDGRARIIHMTGKDVRPGMKYPEDPEKEERDAVFDRGEKE